LPLTAAPYREVRVSPNGNYLAVTLQEGPENNIWLYEFTSRRFWRFFAGSSSEHPVWSPDGKYLVFANDAESPGIYCMRSDGTGSAHRLVDGRSLLPYSISTQPSKLYYTVQRGPRIGPWVEQLDWNGGSPKAGNAQQLPDDGAAISQDQRWLAYGHVVAGTPAVFVRPAEAAGGPWQVGPGGDQPVWSRAQRRLFFLGLHQFQIMAADYSVAGDAFTAASPRLWNPTRIEAFDVMPDGKRAVVIPAIERKQATHAVFLLNFIDDLRRRFPSR